jgi:RNA polymerase sigma factor (sigma-70 family)
MAGQLPPTIQRLIDDAHSSSQEQAWGVFVKTYSRILYHAAKSAANGYDDTMEQFTFVLDELRRDDFKRLKKYASDGRTQFSTWLVVVAGRICIDYHRAKYGRPRGDTDQSGDDAAFARKRLMDLVAAKIDVDTLQDRRISNPEIEMRADELRTALDCAMATLPSQDRILLKLRFEDVASVREIAKVMRFPSQFHVYRRLKAVLNKLRLELEVRGVKGPTP